MKKALVISIDGLIAEIAVFEERDQLEDRIMSLLENMTPASNSTTIYNVQGNYFVGEMVSSISGDFNYGEISEMLLDNWTLNLFEPGSTITLRIYEGITDLTKQEVKFGT